MNQLLIDNSLLILAFVTAFVAVKLGRNRRLKAIPSILLLFAPFLIFFNMWAHIIAVLIVNYRRYVAGVFHYNFHFYSLILFGVFFIVVSGTNINFTRKAMTGDESKKRIIHWLNAGTALLFLPMFVINPIALLPVIASAVSSITLATANFKQEIATA